MILDGVRWVVGRSRHVQIDQERLVRVCGEAEPSHLRLPDWRIPVVPPWRDERLVDWILLFTTINFCYWGEPKWTILFRGQPYDGAFGMMAALTRALEEGEAVLDGAYLGRMGAGGFRHILRGNVPIPLESERLAIWHEVGPVLVREFGGRWHQVVCSAAGSAVRLVKLLVERFPSFDDVATFEGRQVAFYKRAQLAAGMLYQAFGGRDWGAFDDFGHLTVYADYKLPQVLRKLGILLYDGELTRWIENKTPVPAGSRMEVEIRAATVWACELVRQAIEAPGASEGKVASLTAAHVDYWLWEAGQHKSPDDLPYHRTLTTAY